MGSTELSRCLVAETDIDNDDLPKMSEQELKKVQKELHERLVEHCRQNYSNETVANAKAISEITSNFEIIVCGPSRVGKSALIQALSGNKDIKTSATCDRCTQHAQCYIDSFGMKWWDTVGDVVKFLFDQLKQYHVSLFYVITKWPLIPLDSQGEIVDEAIKLLDGTAVGIYPVKPKSCPVESHPVEVVEQSSCLCHLSKCCKKKKVSPEIPVVTESTELAFRALKCGDTSYIVPINSVGGKIRLNDKEVSCPIMNLNLLRILITTTTWKGQDAAEDLLDLVKNQMPLWRKFTYQIVEWADDIGINAKSSVLKKKQEKTYKEIKGGGKNQHIAVPITKAVIATFLSKLVAIVH